MYCKAAVIIIIWADKSATWLRLTAIVKEPDKCLHAKFDPLLLFYSFKQVLNASRFQRCVIFFLFFFFTHILLESIVLCCWQFQARMASSFAAEYSSYQRALVSCHGATLLQCFSVVGLLCRSLYLFYAWFLSSYVAFIPVFFSEPHLNLIGILQYECLIEHIKLIPKMPYLNWYSDFLSFIAKFSIFFFVEIIFKFHTQYWNF
jgi:hypothetical protein